jgi:hypothetical protein
VRVSEWGTAGCEVEKLGGDREVFEKLLGREVTCETGGARP